MTTPKSMRSVPGLEAAGDGLGIEEGHLLAEAGGAPAALDGRCPQQGAGAAVEQPLLQALVAALEVFAHQLPDVVVPERQPQPVAQQAEEAGADVVAAGQHGRRRWRSGNSATRQPSSLATTSKGNEPHWPEASGVSRSPSTSPARKVISSWPPSIILAAPDEHRVELAAHVVHADDELPGPEIEHPRPRGRFVPGPCLRAPPASGSAGGAPPARRPRRWRCWRGGRRRRCRRATQIVPEAGPAPWRAERSQAQKTGRREASSF